MIGLIAGTGFGDMDFLGKTREEEMETGYGSVYVLLGEGFMFIPRHGRDGGTPPHRINHRANITVLKEYGVREVVGVSSVGSLKKGIPPKSLVAPHDYINLWSTQTFFDSEIRYITPGLDEGLRNRILSTAKKLGVAVVSKGVYIQTTGPRLETKAEVSLLRNYGDVVGMTMASEATLARELDLRYASICLVDNFAHGIVEEDLDYRKILEEASGKRRSLKTLMKELIT